MQGLIQWLWQLAFLIFFANVAHLLLPDRPVRKAARLVIGLVIISAFVEPLVGMVADPAGLERLFDQTPVALSDTYLRAGARIQEEARKAAEVAGFDRVSRDVALLLTLVDGVDDAVVHMRRAPPAGVHVEVQVWPTQPIGPEALATKEAELSRLVRRAADPMPVDTLRIVWMDPTVGTWLEGT